MRHPIRKYWLLFGATFAVILIGSGAFIAQAGRDDSVPSPDSAKPKKPDPVLSLTDDELQEVVQVLNLYTLDKDLALTEDQLVRVLPKWRRLVEMRQEFWRDRRDRLGALKVTLAAHEAEGSDLDETELGLAVDRFHAVEEAFWTEHIALRFEMLDALTPAQKVKYILIEGEQRRRASRLVKALKSINRPPQPELLSETPARSDATQTSTVATNR